MSASTSWNESCLEAPSLLWTAAARPKAEARQRQLKAKAARTYREAVVDSCKFSIQLGSAGILACCSSRIRASACFHLCLACLQAKSSTLKPSPLRAAALALKLSEEELSL